jgi:hypothetical protein
MWKKPPEVHGGHRDKIIRRVVGERLADEDPGVVDQGVDPAEPVECLLDDALRCVRLGDVTRHGEDVGLLGGADRP